MKLFRTAKGIMLENDKGIFRTSIQDWNSLINRDGLYDYLQSQAAVSEQQSQLPDELLAPMTDQELWASGVTYFRSKQGRQEESEDSGGADFYQRVYEAERPELFFKATAARVSGPGQAIRIRADSTWDVPEPELVLAINSEGGIFGYTIGNDVSSRSIEGENPLYLPQAKCYDGCAALGPGILISKDPLPDTTCIHLQISRNGSSVFSDSIAINQITRKFEDLVSYLYRECSFPHGALLMTGTGIVPGSDFTLQQSDIVTISIDGIGTLENPVA